MTYRLTIIALVALAVFGVWKGVMLSKTLSGKPPAPPPVSEPARPPYRNAIAGTGIIEATRENVSVATAKPGLVTKVWPATGTDVRTGDPLLQIDDREVKARIATLKTQAGVQAAALGAAKISLAESEDLLSRVSPRTDSARLLTEDELSRRKFAVQSAGAQVSRAEAELRAAEAQLAQAATELEVLTVRASRDGRILQLNIREGEYASASPPQPLMVLGDIDSLQIRADIDEQNAPLVQSGRPAAAFLKGDTLHALPLTFVRIDPFVVPKKSLTGDSTERVDTRVLQVIFNLKPAPGRTLYVGQQVDVYIEGASPDPVPAPAP